MVEGKEGREVRDGRREGGGREVRDGRGEEGEGGKGWTRGRRGGREVRDG